MRPFSTILLLVAACSSGGGKSLPDDAAPQFELLDVNPTSLTFGENMSPRDHVGAVSGWYFGSAT